MDLIHIFTRYDRLGPSSRVRLYQFIDGLAKNWHIEVNQLFPDGYVYNLYHNLSKSKSLILWAYFKRIWQAFFSQAQVFIIEKELLPYLPFWLERLCFRKRKIIIDIDDAWFHRYDMHASKFIRIAFKNKIYKILNCADIVCAGSQYLIEVAKRCGARKVIYCPSVVDIDNYIPTTFYPKAKYEVNIGWVGSKTTEKYLINIIGALAKVPYFLPEYRIRLLIIGGKLTQEINGVQIHQLDWSEDLEVELINSMDIGIMPLNQGAWEKGKCSYKLIQYMACAKPVIASAVGQNNYIVDHGVNGFLCKDNDEWLQAFITLITNVQLRAEFGLNGCEKVRSKYNITRNLEQFNLILKQVFQDNLQ